MTKILLAAKQLRLDSGSEGILASNFIMTLLNAGYELSCVTSDQLDTDSAGPFQVPWLGPVPLTPVPSCEQAGMRSRLCRWMDTMAVHARAGAYLARRVNSLSAYASGYHLSTWDQVDAWHAALREQYELVRPDVIFIRGAGMGFEPHMAMLRWQPDVPWIANYHDPFPGSLYPEPYRHITPVVSRWQEAIHRRILAAADALTFPCQRLLEWVLQGDFERYRKKAFVVPHVATGALEAEADLAAAGFGDLGEDEFLLVHTGTLLSGREPWGLLQGFQEFVQQDAEKRRRARLLLVGKVDTKHRRHPDWRRLSQADQVRLEERRISYQQATALARAAVAPVVLEACAPLSPFFPGKLADCLWMRKPILALSPRQSATVDLLGEDYPLRVAADDVQGITDSLNLLWDYWKQGRLAELAPDEAIVESVSERAVAASLDEVFEWVLNRRPRAERCEPLKANH